MDLQLAPGELVGLVATPARSTAIARTVVGLVEPAPETFGDRSGRVLAGRRDVTDEPPGRRQIGYVPAHDCLLPHLIVRRNLWYGLPRRHRQRRMWFRREPQDRQTRERMDGLIRALELGPALHLRPHELLASQRFHAAVGRAVACMHEVLVVDLPRAVPGAMNLDDVLRRIRAEVPATETMAVLVCTDDPQVLVTVDRTVRTRPWPGGDEALPAVALEGGPAT